LSDQDAVEWVFVNRRQNVDHNGMFARDRQLAIAVFEQPAPQKAGVYPEIISAKASLDRNFP
jgi:hypothetical protein